MGGMVLAVNILFLVWPKLSGLEMERAKATRSIAESRELFLREEEKG